ncbi:hypothetical protein KKA69_01920 [Patescibacteria group bacterium]|nr:hypothetical protein [Patescibacteria group bacterium]
MDPQINTLLASVPEHVTIAPEGPTSTTGEKPLGWFKGIGPLGEETEKWKDISLPALKFTQVISLAIGVMTIIAFIWFVFTLFTGALAWITSGGDKVKVQNAQKQISNGIIGVVVVISAIFLFRLAGAILGINLNIYSLLLSLWP